MKVILKDEVDNLGLAGDVVEVADGYGRNFLLPRGLAILATKGAMKEAAALTRARKVKEAQTLGSAEAAKQVLESRTLRIESRVDERGHLYGSVGAGDVQRVLKERGHDLPRKRIDLKGTIKQIGEYEIPVQVHPQVTAMVTVEVVDAEGKVTLHGQEPAVEVDADEVGLAAADAAEGSETPADVLAEQALEAAELLEQQRLAAERTPEADGGATVVEQDDEDRPV